MDNTKSSWERQIPDGCPACGALPCDWATNPKTEPILSGELRACPFCGELEKLRVIDSNGDGESCFVTCDNCNADGGQYGGADSTQRHEAINLWNRRA